MLELQRRLDELGYWLGGIDGDYGVLTEQAVYAMQKYEGLSRTGAADPPTIAALSTARRPNPRSETGDLVEVDKRRQLLLVIREGRVQWAFNTSTGTGEPYQHPDGYRALADTPNGRWKISWQVNGWREGDLGSMWRPKYFHRDGLAIHGYAKVPPQRASHGCVRLRFAAMDFIWQTDLAPLDSTIWVYD